MTVKQLTQQINETDKQLNRCQRYIEIANAARGGNCDPFAELLSEQYETVQRRLNILDASAPGFTHMYQAQQSLLIYIGDLRELVQDPEKRAETIKSKLKKLKKELAELRKRGKRDHLG